MSAARQSEYLLTLLCISRRTSGPVVAPINLRDALRAVDEFWSPRVVGRVNDQYVKVAKLKGELTWHKHEAEDEFFQVLKGRLRIQFEDHEVLLQEGECCVVPKGMMHNPVADEECWIVLVETVTTEHTGGVATASTRSIEEQLRPLPAKAG